MAVKTYIVNLEGNLESGAKSAASAVKGLVTAMTSLEAATLGITAVVAGLGLGLLGMTGYAIEASERVDRLSASFGALSGQGPEAGRKVLDSVRAIAAELPESERSIQSWAQQLMAVGVTDMSDLRAQLYAISGAEALVEGGGERARSILMRLNEASERGTKVRFNIAQLAGTGLTEQDLLKQLGMSPAQLEAAKKQATLTGGQIATAMTNALNEKAAGPLGHAVGEITTRIRKGVDTISHLFEGLKFDALAASVTTFFSIFDQAYPSGQIMKEGVGGAVQWLGDKLAWLLKRVTLFVLDSIILVLRLRVFWKEHFKAIEAITIGAITAIAVALVAVFGPAILAAIPSVAWFTVMLGALALEAIVAAAPFIALALGIGLVVAALVYFWPAIKQAAAVVEEWAQKGWDAAVNFVAGMVGGIVSGVSRVVDAVKNLGKEAWSALSSFWQAHSPSQLTMQLGANIAEGQARGLESKSGRVASATSDALASVPSGRSGGSSGGGVTQNNDFHFTIVARDGQQAREVVDEFEERLPSIMERWALSQGVAPV